MSKTRVSPVQRSRAYAKERGWLCAIVEHWNPHAFIRQDLFGVFDLLVVKPITVNIDTLAGSVGMEAGIVGVQVKGDTEGPAKAQEKMGASDAARTWLRAGGQIEIWLWSKVARAPQLGVKRTRGAAQVYKLRRIVAESAPGGIAWSEVPDAE